MTLDNPDGDSAEVTRWRKTAGVISESELAAAQQAFAASLQVWWASKGSFRSKGSV
jgi:hypothetical protein